MTSPSTQTLTSGATISSKYPDLGGATALTSIAPLTGIMWLCCGFPNSGKSALLQGCPDAFIFNLDESSTTAKVPRATIWPWMDSVSGRSVDASGPIILTWALVRQKIELLKKLAKENRTRPRMVVFDSLSSAISLLKVWVVEHAINLNLTSTTPGGWKDLNGKAAWDLLYDILVDTMRDLHSHGYGVCYVGHVVNAKIPLGDDRYLIKPELTITDNFYKRLFPWFEMVAAVSNRAVSEQETTEQKVRVLGQEQVVKNTQTVTRNRRVFVTDDTDLQGILKIRVAIPGVMVLPEDGWPVVEEAYRKAAFVVTSPSTKEPT